MTSAGAPIVFAIDDDAAVRTSIQGLLTCWACGPSPSGRRSPAVT